MYELKRIWITRVPADKKAWEDLLFLGGLVPDEQVDYTVGLYDRNKLVATGSTYQNIIKLVAVDPEYQSENLLTKIVMALSSKLHDEGISTSFCIRSPAWRFPLLLLASKKSSVQTRFSLWSKVLPIFRTTWPCLRAVKRMPIMREPS